MCAHHHTPLVPIAATAAHEFVTDEGITMTAAAVGDYANGLTLTILDPAGESQELAVVYSEELKSITVTPATDKGSAALLSLGSGTDGVVAITFGDTGAVGNAYSASVVLAAEADTALSVALVDTVLVVTLGTDALGAADDTKNTATLVAAAIEAYEGDVSFTAIASGDGSGIIVEAVPASFSGGGDNISITTTIAELLVALADYDHVVLATHDGTVDTTPITAAVIELEDGVDGTKFTKGEACYDEDFLYLAVGPCSKTDSSNLRKVALSAFIS